MFRHQILGLETHRARSTMLLEKKGVGSAVEDHAASCKEGTSSLLCFFSSTHLVNDRLGDHNSPKHLEEVVRGKCNYPVWMWVESTGRKGAMDDSHLSTFRARPWEEASSLTRVICRKYWLRVFECRPRGRRPQDRDHKQKDHRISSSILWELGP